VCRSVSNRAIGAPLVWTGRCEVSLTAWPSAALLMHSSAVKESSASVSGARARASRRSAEGTPGMWVFLSARLRTWQPLARLLVHRLAVAAERRDPSARWANLLRRNDSAVTAVSGRSSGRARR
jgi:hypothetical protein